MSERSSNTHIPPAVHTHTPVLLPNVCDAHPRALGIRYRYRGQIRSRPSQISTDMDPIISTDNDPSSHGTRSTLQVRHSGNFSNGNAFVTHVMGGINYQIEHHLFPSMSHMLYAEIAPIVKDACEEFSIPYK